MQSKIKDQICILGTKVLEVCIGYDVPICLGTFVSLSFLLIEDEDRYQEIMAKLIASQVDDCPGLKEKLIEELGKV